MLVGWQYSAPLLGFGSMGRINAVLVPVLLVVMIAMVRPVKRWWPVYLLIASIVLLILLLTPDAYAAFGLIFFVLAAGLAAAYRMLAVARRIGRSTMTDASALNMQEVTTVRRGGERRSHWRPRPEAAR